MKSLLTLLVCFCLLSPPSIIFCACAVVHQYELPVLPVSLPEPLMPHYNNGTDREDSKKHIPRHIWIAVKDKSDELPVRFLLKIVFEPAIVKLGIMLSFRVI